ncbi:ribbon-helix-helix protein, CopG family [Cyanobium sp. Morenito 9A2]|uniref:ribbon-helix-helix protein, CopG family n=1 Tax=Cyanobium sp. Morenito 9A2 TaxID=2823718 RepID=UPI0020CC145C|nr:ribbon-helix-helix protein, CopG family [Cyanobium sp. Morenito 9A2]MCP9849772.1 ribbon-helix-helix protein, CopG family [Cyanobium sp. Morenito 9A2]
MRTIVDLPEPEREELDAQCRQRGLSRAAALREALKLWLQHQQPRHEKVKRLWHDRPADALTLQEALRQEWIDR